MSIANNLSNHVDTFRSGLLTDSLRTPDRVSQILDTRARFVSGEAGSDFSFTHIRNAPSSFFYRGGDVYQSADTNPESRQIRVPWTNNMTPVLFHGTDLEEMQGITSDDMLDPNYTLGSLDATTRKQFLSWIGTNFKLTMSRYQTTRVMALWGRRDGILESPIDRFPLSLTEMFNPDGGIHGMAKDELGKFEVGHPWDEDGEQLGASEPYLAVPRVYYWNDAPGDGKSKGANGGNAVEFSTGLSDLERLLDVLARYSQVVQGQKLAVCDNTLFSRIATMYKDADKYPILLGDEGWTYRVRNVQIEDVIFISDPYKRTSENSIYILHIGDRGTDNGSVFPLYWRPKMTAAQALEMEAAYMAKDIPDGMDFGRVREHPFWLARFRPAPGYADSLLSFIRAKHANVCTEPWKNLLIAGIKGRI